MSTLIIDDFDPTAVGSRSVPGDLLVIDEPVAPYLTERQVISVLVFDGDLLLTLVEEEADVLIFDEEMATQVTDSLGGADFLVLSDSGLRGPPGPEGPEGPEGAVEVYEQPYEPTVADEGAIWIDTDQIVVTGEPGTGVSMAGSTSKITVGPAAPSGPMPDDIWVYSTVPAIQGSSRFTVSIAAPPNPDTNDIWVDTT
jgi:hypothetical protein